MDHTRRFIENSSALGRFFAMLLCFVIASWLFGQAFSSGLDRGFSLAVAGVVVLAAAALLLALQASPFDHHKFESTGQSIEKSPGRPIDSWQQQVLRPVSLSLALFLAFFTLIRLPSLNGYSDNFSLVLVTWLLAGFLYLLAVATPINLVTRTRKPWRWFDRLSAIAVMLMLLLALGLRLWQLDSVPFTLAGDEASQGLEAVKVLTGEIRNPFTTGWLGVPTLSFFINSLSISWLGQNIMGLRLPWAVTGVMTVFATFLLVKQLKGTRLAFVVAALVATYHYHIHYSRLGSNQIADPFFLALALFFLYRALDRKRRLDWALAGCIIGLSFYFYAGARLTVVIILAILAYEAIRGKRLFWQAHLRGLIFLTLGFFIVSGPMLQYAVRFPDDFNSRLNSVGIIQSGWLEREVDIREQGPVPILLDQFRRAALAFNFYPDRTVWYGLRQPLLSPLFGAFFLLGLLYATMKLFGRAADPRSAPMVAWWWGGMLLGGMLTESPPASQRLITLAVPTCYFIALALWKLIGVARQTFTRVPVNLLLMIGVMVFAFQSLTTYFVDFTPKRYYGGGNAEFATTIAPLLSELTPAHHIRFFGAPRMTWDFATLPYLIPEAKVSEIDEPLQPDDILKYVKEERGVVYVFMPHRLAEYEMLRELISSGNEAEIHSPVDGRLMGILYVVPPPTGVTTKSG